MAFLGATYIPFEKRLWIPSKNTIFVYLIDWLITMHRHSRYNSCYWVIILGFAICFLLWGIAPLGAQSAKRGQFTVVIDAGHGGKDPGAVSGKAREKDITLAIAKQLGAKIKSTHPEVKVLYTRERDVFVGLQARADFANRHKASLFMSIHVNSAGKGSSARGTETFVLGLSKRGNNLSVAMRENKVMLLEDDYKTTYRGFDPTSIESYIIFDLMQEAYLQRSIEMANLIERQYKRLGHKSRGVQQEGLWVLSQSAMPSILTEVGFITHPQDVAYLTSSSGQEQMAGALAKAFTQFYKEDTQGREQATEPTSVTTAEAEEVTRAVRDREQPAKASVAKSSKPQNSVYRVQIISSSTKLTTKDKRLSKTKHKVRCVKEGKYYIYTIGEGRSLSEIRKLRKQLATHYKDCFVVEYQSGKRSGRV